MVCSTRLIDHTVQPSQDSHSPVLSSATPAASGPCRIVCVSSYNHTGVLPHNAQRCSRSSPITLIHSSNCYLGCCYGVFCISCFENMSCDAMQTGRAGRLCWRRAQPGAGWRAMQQASSSSLQLAESAGCSACTSLVSCLPALEDVALCLPDA